MGCCCDKQKNEDNEESRRLLNSDSTQDKYRYNDGRAVHNQPQSQTYNAALLNNSTNATYTTAINSNTTTASDGINISSSLTNNAGNNDLDNNQVFDKILSDVIQVSAFDQRTNVNSSDLANPLIQVQDMPFKIKGLIDPTKTQLQLPEGVAAPLSVLAAQPPYITDIKLISNFAQDANACVNNYTLQIPDNVAFNFNQVA